MDRRVIQTQRSTKLLYLFTRANKFPIYFPTSRLTPKAANLPQANEVVGHRPPSSGIVNSSNNAKTVNETNEAANSPKQAEAEDVDYHPPTRYGSMDNPTNGSTNQNALKPNCIF